jgi:2-C-methyl-D-erythritol 4-phosphate cytidylyltransferase
MRARAVAIIPAAGAGARLGRGRPKAYLSLAGVPLLVHTARALGRVPSVRGLVMVVPPDRVERTRRLLARHGVRRVLAVVPGGSERQESVRRGLEAVPARTGWVVVHDAARPFCPVRLVESTLRAARGTGAALCGLPVGDTLKRVRDRAVAGTVDRAGLWVAQTPQVFRRALLLEAHDKARRDGLAGTDDAALVERLGVPVRVVPGLPENIKITTPADLTLARRWLKGARP